MEQPIEQLAMMDPASVVKMVKKIDDNRTLFLNSESYDKEMLDLVLQQLQFRENTRWDFETKNMQSELFPLYQQVIDVYPELFQGRDLEQLKSSLNQSYYVAHQPKLLPH